MKPEKCPFNTYRIHYGIVSSDTATFKDYCRIDCYDGKKKKVGQVLFGSSISPGNNGGIVNNEIHLYFPLSHFSNIMQVLGLGTEQPLALYLEIDEADRVHLGGICTEA